MDYSPPGSSVRGNSPDKNTGVGCHALLQGILPMQGSNPGFPHCRWILHHLSRQGSPHEDRDDDIGPPDWAPGTFSHRGLLKKGPRASCPAQAAYGAEDLPLDRRSGLCFRLPRAGTPQGPALTTVPSFDLTQHQTSEMALAFTYHTLAEV